MKDSFSGDVGLADVRGSYFSVWSRNGFLEVGRSGAVLGGLKVALMGE